MPPQTSTKAIVGFVLSLLPCALLALAGLVVSAIARGEIKRSNGALTGGGLALAGIIIGSLWVGLGTVGMLAAIAIPNFIKFQARSKQVEAKANLKTLGVQLNEFVEAHSGRLPEKFDDLGGVAEASRYSYYLGETDSVLATKATVSAVPEGLDISKAVIIAVGNIGNDEFLDVWSVDRAGHVWHLQDDVNNRESVERL
jgi:hypothetical protein